MMLGTGAAAAASALLAAMLIGQTSGRGPLLKASSSSSNSTADLENLKLLIAVWRHGDRAPLSTYPNDPYYDSEYLPEGEGNLGNRGKLRAYQLGKFLRMRYCPFLGQELVYDTAVLRSTYVPRCIESGQLVFAALYPPATDQRWMTQGLGSIWAPVAFTTLPGDEDNLLEPDAGEHCSLYLEDQATAETTVLSDIASNYTEVLAYIAENAGLEANETASLVEITDTLMCQESLGMTLPNWTSTVYPEPMLTMLGDMYGMYVYTATQRKLLAGVFLNTLKEIATSYQNGSLPERRKLYSYSAHDTTLTFIMAALGVWNGRQPPFSTALLFELHQINSTELGFKVLFRNNSETDPYTLTLPGCDTVCPLSTFEELYEDVFLTSAEQISECNGTSSR